MKHARTLREMFSFKGFRATSELQGEFGDPKKRVIELRRQKKQQYVPHAAQRVEVTTIVEYALRVIAMQKVIEFISAMKDGVFSAGSAVVFTWNL